MNTNEKEPSVKIIDMTLIVTTIICLLPIIFGLIKWNDLPQKVPIHWGLNGQPDSYGSRAMAVFCPPTFIAAVNIFYQLVFNIQNRKGVSRGKKFERIVKWLIPLISLVANTIIYTAALGVKVNVSMAGCLLAGFILVVVGNYLPKASYNTSHRFGLNFEDIDKIDDKIKRPLGFVTVIIGLADIGFAFTPFGPYAIIASIALYVILTVTLMIVFSRKKA